MSQKIINIFLFALFLIGVRKIIDLQFITTLPIELLNEFTWIYYITITLYYILKHFMNKYNTNFFNINPEHKKMYVIKNYVKSFYLACLCCQLSYFIDLIYGKYDLMFVKRCGVYYIMNDIVGLLLVDKLPLTTKIHHLTTTICGFAIMLKENNNIDILTLIVIYAIFSSLAFSVNFYLGYRIYSNNILFKRYLSNISFWTYLLSCIVNWIIQFLISINIIFDIPIFYSIFYFCFLYSVGRDDIILMQWLYNDHSNFKKLMEN